MIRCLVNTFRLLVHFSLVFVFSFTILPLFFTRIRNFVYRLTCVGFSGLVQNVGCVNFRGGFCCFIFCSSTWMKCWQMKRTIFFNSLAFLYLFCHICLFGAIFFYYPFCLLPLNARPITFLPSLTLCNRID